MAQLNPQLQALLAAMGSNQNADTGGPILGGDGGSIDDSKNPWGTTMAPGEQMPDSGGLPGITGRMPDPNAEDNSQNSLLGPHGTKIASLLAGMNAMTNPGTYNTRHPLTLMRQIHPGLISQPSKSGGAFGNVDQQQTARNNVLAQLQANPGAQ